MHLVVDGSLESRDGGWVYPACECGATFGPLPDINVAADSLMQHARERALIEDVDR